MCQFTQIPVVMPNGIWMYVRSLTLYSLLTTAYYRTGERVSLRDRVSRKVCLVPPGLHAARWPLYMHGCLEVGFACGGADIMTCKPTRYLGTAGVRP